MKKLYRFHVDLGRMGDLAGIFVEDEAAVQGLIGGKEVYFGEVLGKHSEVVLRMEERFFKVLTEDAPFIEQFEKLGCETGINPFRYIDE